METASYLLVLTTIDDKDQGLLLAKTLVEKSLAACVQIVGPITSVYRWKGTVETAEEWQVHAKVPTTRYEEVESCLKAIHPYELPEIIAIPLERGSKEYFAWMEEASGGVHTGL